MKSPGEIQLSARQAEVLDLWCHGYTAKDIAAKLHCSVFTVQAHARIILTRLNAKHITEAAYKWGQAHS